MEDSPTPNLPTVANGSVIRWHQAPMTSFVEVPLESGQPYRSIEIQQICRNGVTGLLVATHRPTGDLDVTLSPELASGNTASGNTASGQPLNEQWFRHDPFLSHMTFGSIGIGKFTRARYEVGPRRVDVDVEVTDPTGTTIRVEMAHRFRRGSQPWFVPAVRQEQPTTLRFMSADYIRLLPRWVKLLRVTVDGAVLNPRPFLLPAKVAPFHLARFSGGVFGVGLNTPDAADASTRSGDQITVSDGSHHFTATLDGLTASAQTGSFTVQCPFGPVATGTWARPDGVEDRLGEQFVELRDIKQEWFPGWRHPTRLALYGLRRIRRRNESWHWSAKDGQWATAST